MKIMQFKNNSINNSINNINYVKGSMHNINNDKVVKHKHLNKEVEKYNFSNDNTDVKNEDLEILVEELNDKSMIYNKRMQFEIHETTNRVMVKIIDNQTEDILRELPPEKLLDMIGDIWLNMGLIIDEHI